MKQIIPIMFCFDKNYVIPAAVAIYSLLENNQKKAEELNIEFKLHIVHTDIPMEDREKLQINIQEFKHFCSLTFIDGGKVFDEIWKSIRSKNHFSKEMFFKLMTPSLLPQYEKIIVSDVDVVFLGDVIQEFMSFNTNDKYLVGGIVSNQPESFFPIPKKGYKKSYSKLPSDILRAIQYGIAGGFFIVNNKLWKYKNIETKAMEILKQYAKNLPLPEQDALSIACYPYIKKIHPAHIVCHDSWVIYGQKFEKLFPNIYTQEEITTMCQSPIQLHYAGSEKPWNAPTIPKIELWYQYLSKTVFLNIFLARFEQEIKKAKMQKTFYYRIKRLLLNPSLCIEKICDRLW